MAYPVFVDEVAFDSDPLDASQTYTDVTASVHSRSIRRGRQTESSQSSTGSGGLRLMDETRQFDPDYEGTLINLLPNPAAGTAVTGYVNEDNITVALGSGQGYSGNSVEATATVAVPGRSPILGVTDLVGARMAVTASVPYTLSVYVRMRSNYGTRNARLRWVAYDSGGSTVGGGDVQNATTVLTTSFQRISLTATPPATTTSLRLLAYCDTSASIVGEIYDWDWWQLEQASAVTEYTDGSLEECRWSGTAHQSSSYRGGPHYPGVLPLRRVRSMATLDGGSTWYDLFQTFADIERAWQRDESRPGAISVDLPGNDAFDLLSLAAIPDGSSLSEQYSGERIDALLDLVGWPAAMRDLDTGKELVQAIAAGDKDGSTALSLMQAAEVTEPGHLFVDEHGYVVFHDRQRRLASPYTVSQATFCDSDNQSGSRIPYASLKTGGSRIVNDHRVEAPGMDTQRVSDATSLTSFARRTKTTSTLHTSNAKSLAAGNWLLAGTKDRYTRYEELRLVPGEDSDIWMQCLGRDIGDRITVIRTPFGADDAITSDWHIESIALDIGPGVHAECVWRLSPASQVRGWVLGTSALGIDTVLVY